MGLGCPVVDREQDRVNANSGSQVVLTPGHQRKGRRFCGVDAGSQAQCLVPKPALETRVGAPTAGWRPAPGAKAPAPFCPVSPGQGAWASGDVGAPEQAGGDRLRGRERGKPRDVQSGRGGLKRGERRCQCGTGVQGSVGSVGVFCGTEVQNPLLEIPGWPCSGRRQPRTWPKQAVAGTQNDHGEYLTRSPFYRWETKAHGE